MLEERFELSGTKERNLAMELVRDYLVVNRQGQPQEAVDYLRAIMLAEHCRTQPRHIDI